MPGIQQEEEKTRAIDFVTSVVKNLISNQFSGDNLLMKELTGSQNEKIEQGTHHAIYLKNLIGHLVRIDHELVYDRYAGVLYDALIQKTRKEVLEIFFKYVTPESLIKELVRAVNADLRKNAPVIAPVMKDEWWDEESFELTELGAQKLLQAAGFLKE